MSKRKQIKKSYSTKIMGIVIISICTVSAGYFVYGLTKSFSDENFSINSDRVWCANCQTYHDKETLENEQNKLIWCINCNKFHEPRDESQ